MQKQKFYCVGIMIVYPKNHDFEGDVDGNKMMGQWCA